MRVKLCPVVCASLCCHVEYWQNHCKDRQCWSWALTSGLIWFVEKAKKKNGEYEVSFCRFVSSIGGQHILCSEQAACFMTNVELGAHFLQMSLPLCFCSLLFAFFSCWVLPSKNHIKPSRCSSLSRCSFHFWLSPLNACKIRLQCKKDKLQLEECAWLMCTKSFHITRTTRITGQTEKKYITPKLCFCVDLCVCEPKKNPNKKRCQQTSPQKDTVLLALGPRLATWKL